MSYYALPNDGMFPGYYEPIDPGTPGWQDAPVPGWGANPLRSGPDRVGVGSSIPLEDAVLPEYARVGELPGSKDPAWGLVAGAGAGGILLGLAFGWMNWKK